MTTDRQNVTFDTPDGRTAHGYLALPPGGTGPGLVVIQEWWGLTPHMAQMTDRFAAAGFVALAPDLFGGTVAHDADEAGKLMQELPVEQAAKDLSGAIDLMLGHDAVTSTAVGAVGFCMGGGFVITLAAQQGDRVAAAVPFYGVVQGDLPDFSATSAAFQGHFADQDQMVPPDAVRELALKLETESNKRPEFHSYDADHAFCNDEGANYDRASAELALDRATRFLRTTLGVTS